MDNFEQKISELAAGADTDLMSTANFAADTGSAGITKKFQFDQMSVQTIKRLQSLGWVQSTATASNPVVTKDYVDHNRAAQLFPSSSGGLWATLAALQAGPWYNLAGQSETPSRDEWARVTNASGFQDIYAYTGSAWVKTGTDSFNMTTDQANALNSLMTVALRNKLYNKVGGSNSANTLAIEERTIATPTSDNTNPVAGTTTVQNWLQSLTNKLLGTRNYITNGKTNSKTFYITGALPSAQRVKIVCAPAPGDILQVSHGKNGPYSLYVFSTEAASTTTNDNCSVICLASSVVPGAQAAIITVERVSDGIILKPAVTPSNMVIKLISINGIGESSIVTAASAGNMTFYDPRQDLDEKPRNIVTRQIAVNSTSSFSNTDFVGGTSTNKSELKVIVETDTGKWQMYDIFSSGEARYIMGTSDAIVSFYWLSSGNNKFAIQNISGEVLSVTFLASQDLNTTGTTISTPNQSLMIPMIDYREKHYFKTTVSAGSAITISGIDFSREYETRITVFHPSGDKFQEVWIKNNTKIVMTDGAPLGLDYYYRPGHAYSLILNNTTSPAESLPIVIETLYSISIQEQPGDISLGTRLIPADTRAPNEKNVTSLVLGSGECNKYTGYKWSDSNNPARNKIIITGPGEYSELQEVYYLGQTVIRNTGGVFGGVKILKDNTDGSLVLYNTTSDAITLAFITDYSFESAYSSTSSTTATALTVEDCQGPRTRMLPVELSAQAIVAIYPVSWGSGAGDHVIVASSGSKTQTIVVLDNATARIVAGSDELIKIFNDTADTTGSTVVIQNLSQTDPVILTFFTPYFLDPTIMSVGSITADIVALTLQDARDKDPNSIQAFALAASEVASFPDMQWAGYGHTRIVATIKPATGAALFQEYILYSATEARLINGAAVCINIYRNDTSGALLIQNRSSTDAITVMIETSFNWRATKAAGTTTGATQLTEVDCRVASGGGGGGMALVVGATLNDLASFNSSGQVIDSGILSTKVAQILNTTAKPITFSCTGDELHDKLAEYGQYFAPYASDGNSQTITINITADATDFSSIDKVPVIPGLRGLRFIVNGGNKKIFCPKSIGGGSSLQIANAKLILGANNGWHNFQDMDFLYIQGCSVDASGVPANTARISFNGIKKLYVSISSFTKTQAGNDVSIVINNQDVRILGAACNYNGSAWSSGTNCRFYIDSNVPNAVFSNADNGGTGIYGSAIICDFRANNPLDTYIRRPSSATAGTLPVYKGTGQLDTTSIDPNYLAKEINTAQTPATFSCTGDELKAKLFEYVMLMPRQGTAANGGALQGITINITADATSFTSQSVPFIPDSRGNFFIINLNGYKILMPSTGRESSVRITGPGSLIIREGSNISWNYARTIELNNVNIEPSNLTSSSVSAMTINGCRNVMLTNITFSGSQQDILIDTMSSHIRFYGASTLLKRSSWRHGWGTTIAIYDNCDSKVFYDSSDGGDGGITKEAIITDFRDNYRRDESFVRTDFMRTIRSPVINSGMDWTVNLIDLWKPNGAGYLKVVMKQADSSKCGYIDGGIRWGDTRGGVFDQWRQEGDVIPFMFEDSTDLTVENPNYESWQVSLYYFAG